MSNNKIINNIDEIKENNKSNKNEELIILPKNTEFLNRKTRWERNKEDSILKQFNIKKVIGDLNHQKHLHLVW